MMNTMFNKLKTMKLWNLLWISLILSEVFTAIMDILMGLIWYGRIDIDLLLIGAINAFVVALSVSIILILLFRQIRNYERLSEEAILGAKEEWERTFNSMTDLIMIVDTKHKIVRANKAMAEKLKLPPAETVGITCYEHVHGLMEPPSFCPHSRCLLDGKEHSAEVYEERLGGHYLVTVAPLFSAKGDVVGSVHTARDISESKQAKEKLRETNTLLQTLIQAIPDVIFFKDAQNRYLMANKATEEFTGLSQEQLTGKTDEELLPPELAEDCRKSDEAVAKTRKAVRFEEQYTRADNKRFLDTIKSPVFDDRGNLAGLVGVSRDITERKQAEQALQEKTRQLEDLTRDLEKRVAEEIAARMKNEWMMIQQSKLAAMGEMLGAIAHQWRQPLNVVGLIVQQMEDAHARGKMDKEYLEKMVEKAMSQILRMSKTIDDFRNFYKPDKGKTVFDVMRAVGDVLSLVSAQLAADNIAYKLTCHTHGKMVENEADVVLCAEKAIEGFRNEFEHVILNLVNNARDAIIEKKVRGGMAASERGLLSFDFYNANDNIIIKVSDNGGGIPPEAMRSIFDPYFTTKDPTKGTGLGLYMSKVIVEDHMQGKLSANNAEVGAIFTIELPHPGREVHRERTNAV